MVDGPIPRVSPRPLIDVTMRGLHEVATVRDRCRDERHLERADERLAPWPYAALASSTSSTNPPGSEPEPSVTCEGAVGRSNGMVDQKPDGRRMRRAHRRSRDRLMYQILQETSVAPAQVEAREAGLGMAPVADPEALHEQLHPSPPVAVLDRSCPA